MKTKNKYDFISQEQVLNVNQEAGVFANHQLYFFFIFFQHFTCAYCYLWILL